MIEADYTISYADYKAAQRLYLRHRPKARITYVVFIWLLPLTAICLANWYLWLGRQLPQDVPFDWFWPTAAFVWLAVVFRDPIGLESDARIGTLFPKGTSKVARLIVNEEQLISAIPERSEGRFYWRAIEEYAEDEHGMILFLRKTRFLIVPHHALNEAQWTELREIIVRKALRTA